MLSLVIPKFRMVKSKKLTLSTSLKLVNKFEANLLKIYKDLTLLTYELKLFSRNADQ
jgi:hypothetical protein